MHTREVPHSFARWAVPALVLGLSASACKGCGQGESARPITFVSKDAEAVMEIRDLGVVARSRTQLLGSVGGLVTPEQLTALEQELVLSLGFNPTTEKGLEDAGLPKQGPIAVEIVDGGAGALWIVPVADAAKLEKAIDRVARARTAIETAEKVKAGTKDVTVLSTTFGPEKLVVAAYGFDRGVAFIGAGRRAQELVTKALTPDPAKAADDVTKSPEYGALATALGEPWEVRFFALRPAATIDRARQVIGRAGGAQAAQMIAALPETKGVKSVGWALGFEKKAVEIRGRMRLDDATIAKTKAIFSNVPAAPAGVRAAALDEAIVVAYGAGNLPAMLQVLAPAGSPARAELDAALAKVKGDIGADLEKELFPTLSGHGAVGFGLRSLSGLDLRRLVEDPRILWTTIGLGSTKPDDILAIETKMEAELVARGFQVSKRTSGGKEVHTIAQPGSKDPSGVLVESVSTGGARLFSTEPAFLDRAIALAEKGASDPLNGKPGMMLDLRFTVLTKALSELDLASLPVLYRAIAVKGLQVLRLVERATVEATPADDGVAMKGRLVFTDAAGAPVEAKK
ncbi:hypothetical protein L6R52_18310 [Myxococcota bacterium]|nr:hypothetical protein [Myxococcota bacterium]